MRANAAFGGFRTSRRAVECSAAPRADANPILAKTSVTGRYARCPSHISLHRKPESNRCQISVWGYFWGYEFMPLAKLPALPVVYMTSSIPPLGTIRRRQRFAVPRAAASSAGVDQARMIAMRRLRGS